MKLTRLEKHNKDMGLMAEMMKAKPYTVSELAKKFKVTLGTMYSRVRKVSEIYAVKMGERRTGSRGPIAATFQVYVIPHAKGQAIHRLPKKRSKS